MTSQMEVGHMIGELSRVDEGICVVAPVAIQHWILMGAMYSLCYSCLEPGQLLIHGRNLLCGELVLVVLHVMSYWGVGGTPYVLLGTNYVGVL